MIVVDGLLPAGMRVILRVRYTYKEPHRAF